MEYVEIKNDKDLTVIYLNGRIDTNSSPIVEGKISATNIMQNIIIDTKNLEYISSSGLRIILRLCKKHPNIKMINVSEDIYEILEVTGFADFITVEKK